MVVEAFESVDAIMDMTREADRVLFSSLLSSHLLSSPLLTPHLPYARRRRSFVFCAPEQACKQASKETYLPTEFFMDSPNLTMGYFTWIHHVFVSTLPALGGGVYFCFFSFFFFKS